MVLATAFLFLIIGTALVPRAIAFDEAGANHYERLVYAFISGMAIWFGSTWILSLLGAFNFPAILARFCLALLVASWLLWRARAVLIRRAEQFEITLQRTLIGALFSPLILWIGFILWRGAVIPPVSHDALSYHLPKAVLMWRNAGWQSFGFLHGSIRTTPVNYEWLLAEELAWSGSDRLTEWPSLIFFVLLIVATGALCQMFSRRRSAGALVAMMSVAAAPVVLLHSGAQKNDLMVASLMVCALVAAGRWLQEPSLFAFAMISAAFGLAIGTKPQAAALAVAIAPVILWRLIHTSKGRSSREWAFLLVVPVLSFVLLGGAVFLDNLRHEGSLLNARDSGGGSVEVIPYGDWSNIVEGPYVLLAAPLVTTPYSLSVPWESTPWFWRRYEIYFSHLGILFTLAVAALPIAWWKRNAASTRFRMTLSLVSLAALVLMLPVGFKPHGLYAISLPRYVLFIVPIVLAWSMTFMVERLEAMMRGGGLLALAVVAITFCAYAQEFGAEDTFAPIDYVIWASQHPGARTPGFDPFRAASVADRMAGTNDAIAVESAYGAWTYPAFGAALRRRVDYVDANHLELKDDVKWVVVDRAYQVVWGHPDFRDLSQARRYLLKGKPRPEDLQLLNALRSDRRFELVFYNPKMLQAVFKRVGHGAPR
jgi:hypothetical protein